MTTEHDNIRFEFGRNWKDFIERNLGEERINVSRRHLLDFLGLSDLAGRTFLDIGCGSGLHSVAALRSGAASVRAFDFDSESVLASEFVRSQVGRDYAWTITQGSVLDASFIASLGTFDIVYAWGVLHHTGDVWTAICNAAACVASGGLFYMALYSADAQTTISPEFWLDVKRRYVAGDRRVRRRLERWYVWEVMMQKNPLSLIIVIRRMLQYKQNRGMEMWADIRDWLGGWPMEFVWDREATAFVTALGFEQLRIATGEANTEFLFRRTIGGE